MPDQDDKKSTRRPADQREAERSNDELAVPEGSAVMDPTVAEQAQSIVSEGRDAAMEAFRAMDVRELAARDATARTPVTASSSDITDEIERGGPAFGNFVRSVGLAVAEAQTQLDKTLVSTAEALSKTKIDVIAVFEQEINDETGLMKQGNVIVQQLPLVNYLMPTAYQWSRVFLSADMQVKEFNGANGFNIKGKSSSFSANAQASYGLIGGFGASGGVRYSNNSYESAA